MAQRKLDHGGGSDIDRLSTLPDSVLCHILSFLPTITSVATMSLVSHRWRHLWKCLQVFHFDDSDFRCDKKFALFVNAVLALRRSRDIRKFNLNLTSRIEDHCVEMWVLAAIGPHLEEMYVTIMNRLGIRLPPSFLMNCTNLVSLSLLGEIYMDMNDKHYSVYFPSSLKKLYLLSVVDLEYPFPSGCPALETLDTFFMDGNSMKKVFAKPFSSSKSLKSTNDNFTWTYLDINYQYMTLGIVSYFQSMVEAFHHVFPTGESEFVDPILKNLQDDIRGISLHSRYSTSK
ncbi:F-box/FBD/LRR-repeat protein, partial [Trifolium medium]|nr:F-box/FBD/LRR-repeat protein [Trifolium medium]